MFDHEPKARTLFRTLAAIGAVTVTLASLPATAQAQNLIDFLWGGGADFGGGRSVVAFDRKHTPGQIIVSFGDRRLYHVTASGRATSYPIAVPREQSRWSGVTTVTMKRVNPAWTPTPEMIRENPRLPRWVPGGHPMNPLGNRAMYLGSSTYRIHGTDAPWTIGQAVSKGCIRMFNEDALHLYERVNVGTKVTVTWNRFNTSGSVESASASNSGGDAFSSFYGAESGATRRQVKYRRPVTPVAPTSSPTINYLPAERRAAAE